MEEVIVESVEVYERELLEFIFVLGDYEKFVWVNVLLLFIDGVLGSKRFGDWDVFEEVGLVKRL